MDKALLRKVADAIEEAPITYNQGSFGPTGEDRFCHTPCCIAGHILIESDYELDDDEFIVAAANRLLGATPVKGLGLFATQWPHRVFRIAGCPRISEERIVGTHVFPKPEEAVIILRALADETLTLEDFRCE